ncbi:hypothetical protein LCGC14_2041540, partial [marine sediment metagenome]
KPYGFDWADGRAVDELASIIQDIKGGIGAPEGMHDDFWMSRLITAYVAQEYREELMAKRPECFRGPMDSRQQRVQDYLDKEAERDAEWEMSQTHGSEW